MSRLREQAIIQDVPYYTLKSQENQKVMQSQKIIEKINSLYVEQQEKEQKRLKD